MSLEVKNLVKHFYDKQRGEFAAVDGVSFICKPGEILGLLGPNGAGKTTVMRMIATMLVPDEGEVFVEGISAQKAPHEVRKRIGFLSSETGLYERLTPRETLIYFARLNKYPTRDLKRRVEEVIQLLDLSAFADRRCEKLSTGMKQKVSIARAIVHDPPVIALDEPTNGLDVIAILAMHDFIGLCKKTRKCLLMSTHIMQEAEKLCDQIAIMHKGKIFAQGSLDELRQSTGKNYLEDIFLASVKEPVGELI
jgi:sodium transport system ATP-binding protein